MSRKKKRLIKRAIKAYGHIAPCTGRVLGDSFTGFGGRWAFWFNTVDGSTHILSL